MDGGGRGFFPSSQPGAPGATRARPVSANTRLRQKPAAANQDFFASLGIDAQTSRGRTGSSASSSSNRSFNSVTMRSGPSPAPVPVSAGPPPQIGGWRPPPIGGLGSSRRTSSVSSMTSTTSSTTGLRTFADRSVALSTTVTSSNAAGGLTTESTIATTSNTVAAATTAIGAVSAPPKAEAAEKKKPTQLFSMEDADELYSDDGWNCDSPLAVLSNPMDKAGSAAAMDQVEATSEQKDEFAWGEDDEALVSPVAEPAAPPQVPQSDFTPSGKDRAPFATTAPPVNAFGTQRLQSNLMLH
ncbi:Protein transport protein Sec16B [Phytophthora boehmeriae]|uniref:Protein transport protein Sec16B n=1 Tax=Phytophthora boehmeriae TaxID=109152 RepID=A0A8T1WS52_9STRA|nr:Protein transport protein Sec16B [Phytophthora boehmeriae]